MSNNPNKLAWKGTRGPWLVKTSASGKNHFNITGIILGSKYKVATVPYLVIPEDDEVHNRINAKEKLVAEADAHLISAAPEAIEFIADMLDQIDAINNLLGLDYFMKDKKDRAEEILKKAYNF